MKIVHVVTLLSLGLAFASCSIAAPECNKELFERTRKDERLTGLQKQATLDAACIDRMVIVTGTVLDVTNQPVIEIRGSDGLTYVLYPASKHGCGDLLNMNKGQQVAASGRVKTVYGNTFTVALADAACR